MRRNLNRCPGCLVHLGNCYCHLIEKISTKTRLSLIQFKKEKWLPSNTGQLSLSSLENSTLYERGHKYQFMPQLFANPCGYQSLYLYPSEEATPLTKDYLQQFSLPINLIVPDGTWRQAKKIHRREKFLQQIPHVKLNSKTTSRYTLRRQKYEFGLCTHEAISEALRILEGEATYLKLQEFFQVFLDAHHKNRQIFKPQKKKGIHQDP